MSKSYLKMTTQSLVERAKSLPVNQRKGDTSKEEMDLAIAWMKDEVTITQVAKVTSTTASSSFAKMGAWLRDAYREGKIRVVE
jgi:HD superfamily phosphodiesterase